MAAIDELIATYLTACEVEGKTALLALQQQEMIRQVRPFEPHGLASHRLRD